MVSCGVSLTRFISFSYTLPFSNCFGQPGAVTMILRGLEPTLFPELPAEQEGTQQWYTDKEIDVLCFALRVKKDSPLPTMTHQIDETLDDLITALSQHYKALGSPLKDKTSEQIMKGYFHKTGEDDSIGVCCVLDKNPKPVLLNFEWAQELEIVEPLNSDTKLIVKAHGRKTTVDDLQLEFEAAGIMMPTLQPEWLGLTFEAKDKPEEAATPSKGTKRQRSLEQSPPALSDHLSEALRRRLSLKSGAAASSANGSKQ